MIMAALRFSDFLHRFVHSFHSFHKHPKTLCSQARKGVWGLLFRAGMLQYIYLTECLVGNTY